MLWAAARLGPRLKASCVEPVAQARIDLGIKDERPWKPVDFCFLLMFIFQGRGSFKVLSCVFLVFFLSRVFLGISLGCSVVFKDFLCFFGRLYTFGLTKILRGLCVFPNCFSADTGVRRKSRCNWRLLGIRGDA